MQVPRGVVRFNNAVNNRLQKLWAPYLLPWAVLEHTGRRSGTAYATPVIAARSGSTLYVGILYGEESDWLRNLLANDGGEVRRGGRRYVISSPVVCDAADAPDSVGRLIGRPSGRVLKADITPV